jgi:predicted Zn-dependent protease
MNTWPPAGRGRRHAWQRFLYFLLPVLGLFLALAGCGQQGGEGPGGRTQHLALTPAQEQKLGEQAYQETLRKVRLVNGKPLEQVRAVGERIAEATRIDLLRREIRLHIDDQYLKWDYCVIDDDRTINAFCLPGGKVAVYTGLLRVADSDDELAAVMGHEAAHALAHHASERIAQQQMRERALEAANHGLGQLGDGPRKMLIGLLSAGAQVRGLAYDRAQESEADHIGLFLMTFARYQPERAVTFWHKMERLSAGRREPPEILSTHPHHAQRLAALENWIPYAKGAYEAYQKKRVISSR